MVETTRTEGPNIMYNHDYLAPPVSSALFLIADTPAPTIHAREGASWDMHGFPPLIARTPLD